MALPGDAFGVNSQLDAASLKGDYGHYQMVCMVVEKEMRPALK